jgi:hypothetical protein
MQPDPQASFNILSTSTCIAAVQEAAGEHRVCVSIVMGYLFTASAVKHAFGCQDVCVLLCGAGTSAMLTPTAYTTIHTT